ncbi:helix-turn-helix domain-containing protein [candidate division CSSED10-310 bacterium]|uniref:Helix-turn-helix domain-containing protein n=1 Tax=candidate division CSSED10-310 bacterium TaxID=2855610 RepID=A0ABV6Z5Z2_UNCC1
MKTEENTLNNKSKEVTKKVGMLIAQAHRSKGITQVELAKRLDITQGIICAYEQGRRRIPITKFINIAEAIGISPGKLLDGIDGLLENNNSDKLSRRFLRRLKDLEKLPESEQRALAKTIDAFLAKNTN